MTANLQADQVQEERNTAQEAEGVARATAIVALGNISSRILGLLREIILSNMFGAGLAVDAFKIAIIVPRGIYDLLIGGHVNSALVPVLSAHAERDRDDLWRLLSALLTLIVLVMAGLVLLIEILAPNIIALVSSSDANAELQNEATQLLRITNPALFFLSLFAVLSSLLYALRRFTFPSFAASIFNLTIVITIALSATQLGIRGAALGWLLGSIVQLVIQWLGLRGTGARFTPRLWHPAIQTVALLYAPVMFSLALDVLINRPFSYNLASSTGTGSISYMDWATTLMQFPHGLVATAISVAVLPTLSRQAGILGDPAAFKATLGLGLRLTLSLIIPAAVGLIVLATPVVALIFEHGAFTARDTDMTALALRLYLLGLPFAAIDLLLVFAFYARQDTLTPAIIGLLSLAAYMVTAIALLPYYSFFALMIADSVKHFIHASVSGYILLRRIGGLPGQRIAQTGLLALLAALVMGVIGWGLAHVLSDVLNTDQLLGEVLLVSIAGGVSGVFYLLLVHVLGVQEISLFLRQVRQRL
ncbi:MAG: murein biosynthesis integral membrane protein MurJ [Anaerolineales bacterium]